MKLGFDPADEAFRAELLAFLDEHAPKEVRRGRDWIGDDDDTDTTGVMVIPGWARTWQATLFDHGWMIPAYPPELGGRNATPTQTLIYLEELARLGIPRSVHFGGYAIVGPSLLEFGNEEQRAMAPAAIRGDTVWCVGMSEPNAGSDLANLSTRAVADGDSFVVNGQKVWTSYAMVASRCFCYVRTDPDVPKHKGISVLIIDLDTPGVEVRPLRHISGRAEFAEVFFTDAVVPRTNLVGDLNDGWRVTMGSLAHERGGLWVEGVMGAQRGVDDLVALARALGRDGEPVVRRRIAELAARVGSLRALGYKGFASFAQGSSAPEHSYMKLATSELRQDIYELGLDLQGANLAVLDPDIAAEGGRWQKSWMTGLASTIGGGTSEIQRNVIALRVLGLPPSLTMMDFRLTDEQSLLVDTARSLFEQECPSSLVRSVATDPAVASSLFDRHLRDWVALAGGPAVDLMLFLIEAGAAVAPGPFLASAGFFAPLLAAAGHDLAAAAAAGEAVGTVAIAGDSGDWTAPTGTQRTQIIDLDLVDHVAIVDSASGAPGLVVVPASSLDATAVRTLDVARSMFVAEVPTGPLAVSLDPIALGAAIERMTLAVAAELVGVARWLVDTAVAYAKERVQFGKPIGSFQAIQHKLVDATLTYQQAAAAVAYAAMAIDADDPDRHRAIHVAKAEAGAAARGAAKDAMQVLGGVGYTWEHDLHLRLRRAYADDALCGTGTWHLDRLAELLFAG